MDRTLKVSRPKYLGIWIKETLQALNKNYFLTLRQQPEEVQIVPRWLRGPRIRPIPDDEFAGKEMPTLMDGGVPRK